MKLPPNKGGLGLTCIHMVAKSLKLLQTLRLLSSNDEKSIRYLVYWIGGVLSDLDPDFDKGPHPLILPEFFQELALLLLMPRFQKLWLFQIGEGSLTGIFIVTI